MTQSPTAIDILAEEALHALLCEAPKHIRGNAIYDALQKGELSLTTLSQWAEDPAWRVRQGVAIALDWVDLGADTTTEAHETRRSILHTLLDDEHWRVVQQAVEVLGRHGTKESYPYLQRAYEQGKHPTTTMMAISDAMNHISLEDATLPLAIQALQPRHGRRTEHRQKILALIYGYWKEDPAALENLQELQVPPVYIQRAKEYEAPPLPPWLETEGERRFAPSLLRLHYVYQIQPDDVVELLLLRLREEGCKPLLVYELLMLSNSLYHIKGWLAGELHEFADIIAPMLASWLADLEALREPAMFYLSAFGEASISAIPSLFRIVLTGPKTLQGSARGAFHSILSSGDAHLEHGEVFGYIREILSYPIDRGTWRLLGMLLDLCITPEDVDVAVDYIDLHLPEDARKQQAQFRKWVESLGTDEPSPFLRLIRRLNMATIVGKGPGSGKTMRKVLECEHISNLTHLDFEGIELITATVKGLEGIAETQAPRGITHLYLTSSQLTPTSVALLLSHLALPKLTHLYMANNRLRNQQMLSFAKHPILSQLQMLNLKRCFWADTFQQFAQHAQLSSIRKLNISDCGLTNECIETLFAAGTLPKDSLIDARRNQCHDHPSLEALAANLSIELLL